uniref:L-ascorbate oxidase n=1 Tax=Brassica campestris TaxID=3711 RepID=M4F0T5_BRACM
MRGVKLLAACLYLAAAATVVVHAEDPYFHHVWNVTYGTASPLGVPQQVILINGQFPGPNINSTSNNNVIINVFNNLDEPFLLTWNGIQHRKNCWQDGTPGTMCPIMPGTNYTYHFQPKDQIGSYLYYPTTGMHRAAGGYGGLRVNSRLLIPVPYADPEDDYTVLIGDWYTKSHTQLKKFLDGGRTIGRPDGIVINGKSGKGDGSDAPLFTLKPGKTYRVRICNVGLKTSINFRIQNHKMKLVEMEGSHVLQNDYDSLDVHVGQCFGTIVTANQEPKDYYMVASSRFLKTVITTTGLLRYEGGKGPASSQLPAGPVGWAWSLNQFRSFRWNLTASAARPNPQGSYHYGKINITRTIKLVNTQGKVDGKLRYALNGISHTDLETPLKLAEYFGIADKVFKYNSVDNPTPEQTKSIKIEPHGLTFLTSLTAPSSRWCLRTTRRVFSLGTWTVILSSPLRTWTPEKRKNYNLLDAVSRHTVQVYPKCWAAILLTFDNCGMWNVRSENTERRYLGQQLYASVLSPEKSLRDEYNMPETSLQCGLVKNTPKPVNPYAGA